VKRVYCRICGRETHASATTDKRVAEACARDFDFGDEGQERLLARFDCDAFTAGRRAAFKEALKIVAARHMSNSQIADDIRAASKTPRSKKS
jgi:hypothetical protein